MNKAYEGVITVTSDGTTTVAVALDPPADKDCCTIDFAGGISDSVTVATLVGDVNADGAISSADAASAKQRLGNVSPVCP